MSHHGNENIMVILSSPSGVGKTTLTKKLQQKYQSFKISVSHTTRSPRSNEVDGVDYFFVSHKQFEELIKNSVEALSLNGILAVIIPKESENYLCKIAKAYNLYCHRSCYIRGNKFSKIKNITTKIEAI